MNPPRLDKLVETYLRLLCEEARDVCDEMPVTAWPLFVIMAQAMAYDEYRRLLDEAAARRYFGWLRNTGCTREGVLP